MRYSTLLLSLVALSCAGTGCHLLQCTGAAATELTKATVMNPGGEVLKTITDEGLLGEISGFWRGKTPAGDAAVMATDYVIGLACADNTKSTWDYGKGGHVRKHSERDGSIYAIADNSRLLEIISP